MTEKYKVTQDVMDALEEWRDKKQIKPDRTDELSFVSGGNINDFPYVVNNWWMNGTDSPFENNRRLIAIIEWLNGKDMFDVEKPHKFMVRSKDTDSDFDYRYLTILHNGGLLMPDYTRIDKSTADEFDTYNLAKKWVIEGYEVIETVD